MAIEIFHLLDEGVGGLDLVDHVLEQEMIVSCVHQIIRNSEIEPKLLVCQNDVIRLVDDQDAINCRLSLRFEQRSFEQQSFLSLLALGNVLLDCDKVSIDWYRRIVASPA